MVQQKMANPQPDPAMQLEQAKAQAPSKKSKKKKPSGNRTIAQALLQPSRQLAVLHAARATRK